jgi:hypothetical protein
LKKFYEELRQRNINLILVIAPNKVTIYPDKLPDGIQKISPQSKLDAFADYLNQNGPPVLIDLRPVFQKARTQQDIYYKTETHWNAYGAFLAYQEIMYQIAKSYPQLVPNSIESFNLTVLPKQIHDLPPLMGAVNLFEDRFFLTLKQSDVKRAVYNNDSNAAMTISVSAQKNSPVLLMYMDSFGPGLASFLAPHFSKATFMQIDSKYPDELSLKTVDIIKPNIVIVEIAERTFNIEHLDHFLQQMLSEEN